MKLKMPDFLNIARLFDEAFLNPLGNRFTANFSVSQYDMRVAVYFINAKTRIARLFKYTTIYSTLNFYID
jgi:hypothetical protein